MIESTSSFQPKVELKLATGSPNRKSLRPGEDVTLVAKFTGFLGEPTKDVGEVIITTTKGELHLPNGGMSGREIRLAEGTAPVSDIGEFPVVLRPSTDYGKAAISLRSKLGVSTLEIDLPRPVGFALSEILESIIYAFMVAIVIRIFFFQTFWIPSGSMEPTLYEGDRILANKLVYRLRLPQREEVIIFRVFQPGMPGMPGKLTLEDAATATPSRNPIGSLLVRRDEPEKRTERRVEVQDYIKRVIGLPGDVVEVNMGVIYVNSEPLNESYQTRMPNYSRYGPITVPPGEVFVLGDNRANSQDSHVIGTVPIRNIEGRAELVFWPPRRVRLISQGGAQGGAQGGG